MAAIATLYAESPWLRVVPLTASSGVISAVGTKEDFTKALKSTPNFVGAALSSASAKWHTTEIANGNKMSVPDNSANYNVMDGTTISEDSNASTTGKIDCSVLVTAAQRLKLIGWFEDGTPVIVSREIGKDSTTGLAAGYEYILGIVTDLKDSPQKGPSYMDFSITGKVVGAGGTFTIQETVPGTPDVDESDYNAVATGGSNTITPHNDGAARTITALDSTDWTRLLTGKVVTQ